MPNRKYTGWDSDAAGRRPGTEKLIQVINFLSGRALWNNGSWVVRPKRGKSSPSVHGTGRAFDMSWRAIGNRGSGKYEDAVEWMEFLTNPVVAEALEIEAVFDYYPAPYGRGWKCDRQDNGNGGWQVYDKRAFAGAPGGDWIHVELSNRYADDPAAIDRIVKELFAGAKVAADNPQPKPASKPAAKKEPVAAAEPATPYSRTVKRGSRGDVVKQVQSRLADLGYKNSSGTKPIVVDGRFGPNTERRVKEFQGDNQPAAGPVDGIVGKITWSVLFK